MELITLKLDEIKPYERNARKNDQAVDAVAESIRQCEYIAPIIVDENHVILAGHTRLMALKKLGRKDAECVIKAGLTDEQKKKYRLLDNKTAELAEWDFDLLVNELDGLDFGELDLDWGVVSPDDYEDSFSLPDGEKESIQQLTFTLADEQAELVKYAVQLVQDEIQETFGNQNKNGNGLYEVVRQWAEQRK